MLHTNWTIYTWREQFKLFHIPKEQFRLHFLKKTLENTLFKSKETRLIFLTKSLFVSSQKKTERMPHILFQNQRIRIRFFDSIIRHVIGTHVASFWSTKDLHSNKAMSSIQTRGQLKQHQKCILHAVGILQSFVSWCYMTFPRKWEWSHNLNLKETQKKKSKAHPNKGFFWHTFLFDAGF